MSVRTKLAAAFLVLAVLPLSGIVLYTYLMSQRAVRRAVWAEVQVLAAETGDRLMATREELNARLEALGRLPVRALLPGGGTAADAGRVYTELMAQLGDAAGLVDFFEYSPLPLPPAVASDFAAETPAVLEPLFIFPSQALAQALRRVQESAADLEASGLSPEYVQGMIGEAIKERRGLEEAELEALAASQAESRRLLGREFNIGVMRDGRKVGILKAQVAAARILRQVLEVTPRKEGEVPFALDSEGNIHAANAADREVLEEIAGGEGGLLDNDLRGDWILAKFADPGSALSFGIARPIGASLREIRDTAVRNFGAGLAMILLSLAGVLILSRRMTRNLTLLTEGAGKLAEGDLETRVALRSKDEFGRLADTFNRMARELTDKQRRLLEEERRRGEDEVARRLLEAEHERKSRELEEARQFQLSLLPKGVPSLPRFELAVHMQTAAEVGGDYYDFFPGDGGSLTGAIGDAAGHGARAGTMVTVVKGLLTAAAARAELPELLLDATRAIRQMDLRRMNMAVTLFRIEDRSLSLAAAGMPPVLLYRRQTGTVEEIALTGLPLGSPLQVSYQQRAEPLSPGDTALLMTDGFPELMNGDGEPLGYRRALAAFAAAAAKEPREIIVELTAAAESWAAGSPLRDDITFVVLKAI